MNLPFHHLQVLRPHLEAAGAHHNVEPPLLAAVCWRETQAGIFIQRTQGTGDFWARSGHYLHAEGVQVVTTLPRGWSAAPGQAGPWAIPEDGLGWGRGLMQHDYAAEYAWLQANDWRDPAVNIDRGAEVLAASRAACGGNVFGGICGYNAGPERAARILAEHHGASEVELISALDRITTGHDYVAYVVEHWRRFRGEA